MRRFMVVLAFLIAAHPEQASSQAFGPEVVWGDDTDIGIGGRVELGIGSALASSGLWSQAALAGAFDYFFPDCSDEADCSYWELHGDLLVPITAASINPYLGAGLHLAHASVDIDVGEFDGGGSSSDVGIDVLGGLRFSLGTLSAFTELRLELIGAEQFEIGGGLLFGQR